jgi:hypothetical protein
MLTLSRRKKLFLLFLTIWPIIWAVIVLAFVVSITISASDEDSFDSYLPIFAVSHFLTIFLYFAVAAFYIWYAVKTVRVKPDSRIIWVLLFIFFPPFSHLAFWFMYIWPEDGKFAYVTTNESDLYFVCPKCKSKVSENERYCLTCGQSLVGVFDTRCPKCERAVVESWKVCAHCGEPFRQRKIAQIKSGYTNSSTMTARGNC